MFARDYKRDGIRAGRTYRVRGHDVGTVRLADENGDPRAFQPARTSARNIAVFEQTNAALAAGDRVSFSKNDKQREISNGDRATVAHVEPETGRVVLELDAGGTLDLDMTVGNDRHLRHDYATTAHASQSRTADRVLLHAESGRENLINQKMLYVAISRARDSVHIVTDDRQKLVAGIRARTGESSRAMFAELERAASALGQCTRQPGNEAEAG